MSIERKALVVGVNYDGLKACEKDATEFANLIATHEDGSRNFDVQERTKPYEKGKLMGDIIELFKSDDDTVLFYYSGHGAIDATGGSIVTPDNKPNDIGISMDDILIHANRCKAKHKILILDCCSAGALGNPAMTGGQVAHLAEGVTIMASSRDYQESIEIVNQGGVFTKLLMLALQGGAADLRGYVTPGNVYSYIDQSLGSWNQRPMFKANVSRFTSIRNVAPRIPLDELKMAVSYFQASTDLLELNPSFEETNHLEYKHEVLEPYADAGNIKKFKHLQKMNRMGLLVPVGEEHMYWAAIRNKPVKLTPLGEHYWRLVKDKRI